VFAHTVVGSCPGSAGVTPYALDGGGLRAVVARTKRKVMP